MKNFVSHPAILTELSIMVNNILLYGDPEIRKLIQDLIREFHNQLLSDPKTLVAMKSFSNSQLNRKMVQDPCLSKDEPIQIMQQMGKRFVQKAKSKYFRHIPGEKGKILKT
ncbi:hypothetical protein IIB34_08165 [PVC group bacterium]|nr:hypothetical protein [PVC group bacterium]